MPKEYIVTEATRRRCDQEGGPREAIKVGWSTDGGYVQIATVAKAGVEGANRPLDPPGLDDVNSLIDVGQFVDLDRASLNRLIRVLRTARDKAFGADA